jgi:hypothetical protein
MKRLRPFLDKGPETTPIQYEQFTKLPSQCIPPSRFILYFFQRYIFGDLTTDILIIKANLHKEQDWQGGS